MIRRTLEGVWTLYEYNSADRRYPVTVPGSVLSALLDAGVIPDPYYGRNEYLVLPCLDKDYCFERAFEADHSLLRACSADLVCEGIDTIGEIYINGRFLASVDNMHRTWRFPIGPLLKSGTKRLRIRSLRDTY